MTRVGSRAGEAVENEVLDRELEMIDEAERLLGNVPECECFRPDPSESDQIQPEAA